MNIEGIENFITSYIEAHPDENEIQPILYLQQIGIVIYAHYNETNTDLSGQYFKVDDGIYRIPFSNMETNELDIYNIMQCNKEAILNVITSLNSDVENFRELLETYN